MMELGCWTSMNDQTWNNFLPFCLFVSTPHSVVVSDRKRYIIIIMVPHLLGI